MEEWKTYKLSEIGTIVGGATPSTKVAENYDGDIPWITPKDLSNFSGRFIEHGERNITQKGFDSCSCQMLPKNSVLFSSRAPIGYVAIAAVPLCTNQGFKSVVPNEEIVDPRFLYYLLKFNKDRIAEMGSGTTFMEVSGGVMKNVEVSLPELMVQEHIADVLSSIDEKIELNNRINHNLEDCLFSLYIRLLENQCGSSTIGQVSERIYSGGTPDTKNSDFWGGAINWLSSGETSERFIIDTEKRITENGVRHSSTKYASKYDVVIASAGQGNTRGQTSMTLLNTCINQSVIVIHANSVEAPAIFCSLANRYDELRAISDASSIRGSLTTKMISALEIPIFPEVESVKFSSQAMCLIDQIENNLRENRSLKEQRDTLLPKLMGGELCK